MFKYYLFLSFHNIKRNLSFSLINISGLSIGLALSFLLLVWLQFEFSFDRFHKNADKIYRVVTEINKENLNYSFAALPAPLGDVLLKEIPEITDYVRFGSLGRVFVNYNDEQYWENVTLADPSIFKLFSFKLVEGNRKTALNNPGSIIISRSKAVKYFGDTNPMGKTLFLGERKQPFVVTGIMEDIPANSQLKFDFLSSFSEDKSKKTWGMWNYSTYIMAKDNRSYKAIAGKLPSVVKNMPNGEHISLHIQPLLDIHLHSRLKSDLLTNTDIKTVYIISSILVLVLIIACINYMNLSTARFVKRGKESGIRKVTGATVSDLTGQFLGESFAIVIVSFFAALILCYLFFPVFVSLTGIRLTINSVFAPVTFIKIVLLVIAIAVISGTYPALLLSSVKPVSVMRNEIRAVKWISVQSFRKGLVVFQFFISIILVAAAILIRDQLNFIRNKDIGLNPDQVIVVPVYKAKVKPVYETFKNELVKNPAIHEATAVSYFPGQNGYNQNVWWEGLDPDNNSHYIDWLSADEDFLKTLDIELLEGNFYDKDIVRSDQRFYVLNEEAAKMTGWKDPIGKQFDIIGKGRVIGVVKDFNFKSLHNELNPAAITFYPAIFDHLMIKVSTSDIKGVVDYIRKVWDGMFPLYPFEYSFLNDDFQKMYTKEIQTSKILTSIAILALFVSCIGLFGLVLFTIDSKTKEIGIRKVSGSTTGGMMLKLNFEFVRLLIVAFVFACPVILFVMRKWLQGFAYRITIGWWVFAAAGLVTIILSLLTVSWHTWKSANQNPVKCLRHE
ncbi:MAG TPA: ABC transporter permease [Bacteroidales bacterium]|nr:ABC transporter permease [Bacteroidales bacterium]